MAEVKMMKLLLVLLNLVEKHGELDNGIRVWAQRYSWSRLFRAGREAGFIEAKRNYPPQWDWERYGRPWIWTDLAIVMVGCFDDEAAENMRRDREMAELVS